MICNEKNCNEPASYLMKQDQEYFDEDSGENDTEYNTDTESITVAKCKKHFLEMYPEPKTPEEIEALEEKKRAEEEKEEAREEAKKPKRKGWW